MGRYRFARSPRWIATHALIAGLVVGMASLGFWQLQRLEERRDRNDLVEAQMALVPVPVGELIDVGDEESAADDLRFRAVTAAGEYRPTTVMVRTNQDGAPGGWLLSALALDGGEVVAVLRGFAGTASDGSVPQPGPPSGVVEVEGVAIPVRRLPRTAQRGVDQLRDAEDDLLPVIVQLSTSAPADAPELTAVPAADLDEGPHLSYAVQWFLFAGVVAAGYPFLLRRRARGG